ncbi:hypothetical protein ASN18_2805 [Candidatus Magnetominusculus xianensis]|uniref:Uncharacterized protein n=1 Tax=Candidatus Magnetominusculus xianensis TaxID=1748249 RepID=A0ABR5SC09_9BACT|nr:hypothetical protein ASN18_2805 [Candidatus Magnetominusculus xianensis]
MRGFQGPSVFDPAQDGQQFRRGDGPYGPFPQPGKHVPLKATQDVLGVVGGPSWLILGEPLHGHGLKGSIHRGCLCRLGDFAMLSRINAIGQQAAGLLPAFPCQFQSHVGIDSQGQELFLPIETVLETPPLTPGGGNLEEHAAPIGHFKRLFGWLGLPDGGIGQGHGRVLQKRDPGSTPWGYWGACRPNITLLHDFFVTPNFWG